MPKVNIQFTLPEEQEEHKHAVKGWEYHAALYDVANEIFRPARKHGYSNIQIQKLINKLDEQDPEEGATELISLLEKEFYDMLSERNISIY